MLHQKVRFKGKLYWLHNERDTGIDNLSPIDHYADDGELLADPFSDISFAIVAGEDILQFGVIIGKRSELEVVSGHNTTT